MGIQDVSSFEFMDNPPDAMYTQAFKLLKDLNCITSTSDLSSLGLEMSILPTEPLYSHLLLTALRPEFGLITESIITIVAVLSVENPVFYSPRLDTKRAERRQK
jgi:HrpA-like RNA helicase